MTKSSKPKKKQEANVSANNNSVAVGKVDIGGSVGGNLQIGNITNNFEAIKTTYGLFTIPQPVTDFTGREEELAQLKASFEKGAIISGLGGSGGIGKSELARKLAHAIKDHFPDAQMNIDLLGTSEKPTSPEDAMRRLLEPFYVGQKLPDDETQLRGLYQQTFANKTALLLLDNAANAAQVRPLIPPAPSAAIITSRQHFSLSEFGMREPLRLDVLSPEKATELLRSASPKLNDASAEEVNQLSKLCGHLPLALRVAASLLNDRPDWTVATLLHRLLDEHTRLKRLKREGDYDVEAMLNLSYELLDDDLKKHFRALGIFTAPFAKISVGAVLDIDDEDELDDVLGKLLGRNFLKSQTSQEVVETLYSLHDLTRLYATQKLLNEKEYENFLSRHAEHLLEWASMADNLYKHGNENILSGLMQFRFIWIHLHSIYERLLPEQKPRPQSADRWLTDFPYVCAYLLDLFVPSRERVAIFQAALGAAIRLGDKRYQGIHFNNLGNAYGVLGDTYKSIEFYEKGLNIFRKIGNRKDEGSSLGNLGNSYLALGNMRKAIELYEQALIIAAETGNRRHEGNWLGNLGTVYFNLGDVLKAIDYYTKQLIIIREIGDYRGEGASLSNLGNAYQFLGDAYKSIEYHEQALNVVRKISDKRTEGTILGNLGVVYRSLGNTHQSIEYFERALEIAREVDDYRNEGNWLGNLGNAYSDLGNTRMAIEFYEQGLAIDRKTGDRNSEALGNWNLGIAYEKLGNIKKAIDAIKICFAYETEIGHPNAEKDAKKIEELKSKL